VPVRDTQTDTHTDRQTNSAENKGPSGLQSGQQTDRQTDRQTMLHGSVTTGRSTYLILRCGLKMMCKYSCLNMETLKHEYRAVMKLFSKEGCTATGIQKCLVAV